MVLNLMFISSNYPPRVGGPATTVPQLAKLFGEKNIVSVVAFREKGTAKFENSGFKLYRSPSFYLFGFQNPVSVIIRTIFLSFYARKVAYKENPSIIHAHDCHISAIAAFFVKLTSIKKRKVIVKYAGDLALEFSGLSNNKGSSIEEIFNSPSYPQKFLISLQRFVFSTADFVHVQNNYQKNILTSHYKINMEKIFVLPNHVDINRFANSKKENKKSNILLIVSRIVPWKGIDTAIRALPVILKSNPKSKLKIIGEGNEKYVSSLVDLAKKLGVENKVIFAGSMPNSVLGKEYVNCSVFLQPSLYEPFGISVIEAFSCGKAVVASNVGGLVELVKGARAALLFEKGNELDLAEKVLKAGAFSEKICSQNEIYAKNFRIKNIFAALEGFYKGIKV